MSYYFKGMGGIILAVLSVLFLLALIGGLAFGFKTVTAGIRGRGEAHQQIQSAEFRLSAYSHFFNLCTSVQNNEAQIDALDRELPNYDKGTSDYSRTLSNITGVTAARNSGINQYNQDSLKDYTEAQFKDSDLPFQLPVTEYKPNTGGRTRCAIS